MKGPGSVSWMLPAKQKLLSRSGLIKWVSSSLHGLFCRQDFSINDYTTLFEEQELLIRDGISLTEQEWNVFANELANLVQRTLN